MLWHIELAVECLLLAIIWYRRCPQAFGILIGTDCAAQLAQIILYRGGYVELARVCQHAGVAVIFLFRLLAIVELLDMEAGRLRFWHARILAFWTAGSAACAWLEVGQCVPRFPALPDAVYTCQPNAQLYLANKILLAVQLVSFAAWIVLYFRAQTDTIER